MKRFTITVKKVPQSSVKEFQELDLFHQECGNYSLKIERLSSSAWSLKCKRCKREIIVKDNALGNMPIMQTAVDGEMREFNHELAIEKVMVRN